MEHILNEAEMKELFNEVQALNEKIYTLDKRKNEIKQTLLQNAIKKVKARFPGVEFNDKVKVVRKKWEFNNPNATEEVIAFMGTYFIDRYFHDEYSDPAPWIKLELYQVKKDGTRSLRKDETPVPNIISIEKITE